MARKGKSIRQLTNQLDRLKKDIESRTGMSVENPNNPMFRRYQDAWRAYVDYTDNIGNAEIQRRGIKDVREYQAVKDKIESVRYRTSAYTQGQRDYRDGTHRGGGISSKGNIVG